MYRILLAVNDDEARAHDQAAFVTDLPMVADDLEVVVTHTMTDDEATAPGELQSLDRIETVRAVRDQLEAQDIGVELAEARRPPADGILELADEFDVDLIVIGARRRSPVGKAVFGSITQQIILESGVPVTVAGFESD